MMDPFVAFKYLHVVSMFFAIALAVSTELVVRRVAQSLDAVAIRTTISRTRPLSRLSDLLFIAGIAFGIVAALTGQMNLLAPWLIASYVAVACAFAIGGLLLAPWLARLDAATAVTNPTDAELRSIVHEPAARAGTWGLMALVALLVFLMVVKPLA